VRDVFRWCGSDLGREEAREHRMRPVHGEAAPMQSEAVYAAKGTLPTLRDNRHRKKESW
jgi:hypothetical protein